MSSANPAAPALIGMLQAVQQFINNIGTDPQQWPVKVPGALTVLMGTVELELPVLAQAEAGAVLTDINAKIAAKIKSLQG